MVSFQAMFAAVSASAVSAADWNVSSWALYKKLNGTPHSLHCHPGYGGDAMSADDSPLHTSTRDECFAACLQADACVAVEFLQDTPPAGKPGSCWLRSAIRPSECELIAGTGTL